MIYNKKILEHDLENSPPIIISKDLCFFYVDHQNIRILAITKGNANSMMIFAFLDQFLKLLQDFLGNVEADTVRDNTIMIYELLDEIIDNGYPQSTDTKLMEKYMTSTAKLGKSKNKKQRIKKEKEIVEGMVSSIPWRTGKFKYSKNEAYLDVIEKINMVISGNGQVLKSEVDGTLKMKCKLSGMPEVFLGLNDKKFFEINKTTSTQKKTVDIQDIQFHQCVRLAKFENDRTISFVPPDGEFDLINYRMVCPFKALFSLEITYEKETDTKIQFTVNAKSNYKNKVTANFVEFRIPVPADAQKIIPKPTLGEAIYQPDDNCISWKLHSLQGKKEMSLNVKLELPSLNSNSQSFKNIPVRVCFDIPYYTLSGLNVRYLKIQEQSKYRALSWVRYIAKNGEFVIRTNRTLIQINLKYFMSYKKKFIIIFYLNMFQCFYHEQYKTYYKCYQRQILYKFYS